MYSENAPNATQTRHMGVEIFKDTMLCLIARQFCKILYNTLVHHVESVLFTLKILWARDMLSYIILSNNHFLVLFPHSLTHIGLNFTPNLPRLCRISII